jgi:5-methylcytosine-specific restriction endonuclease McrA
VGPSKANQAYQIYWPHAAEFAGHAPPSVLRQNTAGQAEIVSAIVRFRTRYARGEMVSRWQSRLAAPDAYERLVRLVEWKLIEMPLPRLQVMGQVEQPFIYEIHWDQQVQRRDVERYLAGEASSFDSRVLLRPGVGEYLLQLNGLLRPLIQRRWAAMVAQLNRLEESQLEAFLFGTDRTQTARIRAGLWEIQKGRCFYCDVPVRDVARAQVDHFIPWSRYPDDTLDNLVVADITCNGFKSRSLAAASHVARWVRRFVRDSIEHGRFADIAERTAWERRPDRSLNVARGVYLRLPDDARLWLRSREFVPPDLASIRTALTLP